MIFAENINHNPGLFNDTAGERQDPAKKMYYAVDKGFGSARERFMKKPKGG